MVNLLSKLKAVGADVRIVRVYTADDEHRDVAVPTRRRKWTHVMGVVERMPWVRCELLDKSGNVLDVADNDGAPGEVEDISGAPTGTRAGELRLMMEMTQRAVDRALAHRNQETAAILAMVPEVMRTVVQANSELARVYRMAANAAGMGARAAAEAELASRGSHDGEANPADALVAQLAIQYLTGAQGVKVAPVPNGERKRRRTDGKGKDDAS